jgi:3-phosphoshikimate 1-carboxyvinyltransferase
MPSTLPPSLVLPPAAAQDATPRIPGSKSITNRALLLAAIAEGTSTLTGWLDADDTRWMLAALADLGVGLDVPGDRSSPITLAGTGGPWRVESSPTLQVGTAGTVARFVLALCAGSPGQFTLDGSARMRERPMATLVHALRDRGATIVALAKPDALPLQTGPHRTRLRGGEIRLDRPASSQFVSGIVLAALLADAPTTIVLEQGTPARPYVDMTLAMIRSFSGSADWIADDTIAIAPTPLRGRVYAIEPDASAASYFLARAAIHGGTCTIEGLGTASLQGDARFIEILGRMGARVAQDGQRTQATGTGTLTGGSFDLSDMPDMTLTLAVVALHAKGPTRITGVGILRHHESDRLAAVATELRKLGASVTVEDDGVVIDPPTARREGPIAIDTYDDHRMAMAFAIAGDIEIRDPSCVTKTFPTFFDELAR